MTIRYYSGFITSPANIVRTFQTNIGLLRAVLMLTQSSTDYILVSDFRFF